MVDGACATAVGCNGKKSWVVLCGGGVVWCWSGGRLVVTARVRWAGWLIEGKLLSGRPVPGGGPYIATVFSFFG